MDQDQNGLAIDDDTLREILRCAIFELGIDPDTVDAETLKDLEKSLLADVTEEIDAMILAEFEEIRASGPNETHAPAPTVELENHLDALIKDIDSPPPTSPPIMESQGQELEEVSHEKFEGIDLQSESLDLQQVVTEKNSAVTTIAIPKAAVNAQHGTTADTPEARIKHEPQKQLTTHARLRLRQTEVDKGKNNSTIPIAVAAFFISLLMGAIFLAVHFSQHAQPEIQKESGIPASISPQKNPQVKAGPEKKPPIRPDSEIPAYNHLESSKKTASKEEVIHLSECPPLSVPGKNGIPADARILVYQEGRADYQFNAGLVQCDGLTDGKPSVFVLSKGNGNSPERRFLMRFNRWTAKKLLGSTKVGNKEEILKATLTMAILSSGGGTISIYNLIKNGAKTDFTNGLIPDGEVIEKVPKYTFSQNQIKNFISIDVTEELIAWHKKKENPGWLFVTNHESPTEFGGPRNGNPDMRPRLVLVVR